MTGKITRGDEMLALRKRRTAASHPFLRGGFRPFFFGAALWALVAISIWLGILAGRFSIPSRFEGVAWHRHEMLFGFVGAAVVGFLLTAIPNWTGRLPIAGKPLLSLFGIWAAARLAVMFSSLIGIWTAAVLDVGLFWTLALLAGREVFGSKNRNFPMVGLVFAFGLADAADYLGATGFVSSELGWRSAIALLIVMISIIGGKITPSFTRNWLVKQGRARSLPTQPQTFDRLVIVSTAIAFLFWLVFPDNPLTGGTLILAGIAHALRLSRWHGWQSLSDPLVLVLHLGYAWVPIGLVLLGTAVAGLGVPQTAGVHALTAGAMTTMILAVMTRASLGHTGRALRASAMTIASYACVTAGAVLRVVACFGVGRYPVMLELAGVLWGSALVLFLIVYVPILWTARLGDRI